MSDKTTVLECPISGLQSPPSKPEQSAAIIDHHTSGTQPPTIIDLPPSDIELSHVQTRASAPRIRNGKIAHLPKLERDMVNRMLHNHVPYSKIVGALDELNIKVTERNVSNWKTRGGYKEWCVEQERQLNLSRLQDNLTDYLRKNDAGQLPEVGLQIAATQLTHLLLQPDAVRQLTAEPEKYSKVVDMLCRLSAQIQALQKDRNEAVNRAAIRGTSEQLKRADEKEIDQLRWSYTAKLGEGPRDADINHRNELPKRDQLPFREPGPKAPSLLEIMDIMREPKQTKPALPAPQSKPAENSADQKSTS